jgi:hypothetical protein
MRTLLLTPPLTQLNTPYPATQYLTGFLRSRGHEAVREDLALALVLRLLSREGLEAVGRVAAGSPARAVHPAVGFFVEALDDYRRAVGPVVRFLQGRDPGVAYRIVAGTLVPEGPRFATLDRFADDDPLGWAFGALGLTDRARHLATLFIEDIADVVRIAVDPRFGLVRYAERLAHSQPTFDPLRDALEGPPTLLDTWLDALAREAVDRHDPDVVALTAPFAGNAYAALRIGRAVKAHRPRVRVVLGGGWVNTDLRGLRDPRVFDYVDRITLDAGERPLLNLLEEGPPVRTFRRTEGPEGPRVVFENDPLQADIPFDETGTPTTDGLELDAYLQILDTLNPMHRLWADTRWNKLTVAHGCYWRKCSFCDTSLDYIQRYEPAGAAVLADRIEALAAETGQTGFHFVDEAAPPRALAALSDELLSRDLAITWWGNIRFERTFTPELCEKLADAGCVAITGGLEVASDRLLRRMRKGVSIPQVARVTRAFADAGILVHAYLMYGFPTQTLQETVDSLEVVRQLFAAGCLHSAFWHRFAATAHAPVAMDPEAYGIELLPEPDAPFGRNDIPFADPTGADHDALGPALDRALYNYLHGVGLEEDVRSWFDGPVPATTVPPDRILQALAG